MAQIDTLLQKLSEMNAQCADLRADEQVEVVAAGIVKKGAHVTADQLRAFLVEIIPSNMSRELDRQLPFEFTYSSPHGLFEVSITWSAGRMQAVIEPSPIPLGVSSVSSDTVSNAVASRRASDLLSVLLIVSVVVVLGIGCMVYLQQ